MKRIFLIIFYSAILSISSYSQMKASYLLTADGNAYIETTITSNKSIDLILNDVIEVISPNIVHGGKIVLNNNKTIIATYVFKTIERGFPISIDANVLIKVNKEDEIIRIQIVLIDYDKSNPYGKVGLVKPIKETKPLKPNGSNFGFGAGKIKKAFYNTVGKSNELLSTLQAKIKS